MTRWLSVAVVTIVIGLSSSVLTQEDAILKRQEARFAALRSGQGREQFYSRHYISIAPPGTVVVGYHPTAEPNPKLYAKDIKVVAATKRGAVVTLLQGPRPAVAAFPSTTDPDRFLEVWANEGGTWRVVARQGVWVRPAESQPPSLVKAPDVSPYKPTNAAEGEVFKAHQAIEDGFARHDAATYERIALPEFIRIAERGQVATRPEWIKTNVIGNMAPRMVSLVEDVRIRVFDDIAVMSYRNIARNAEGMTPAIPTRMMRAWVRRDDGWKLAATISTLVWPEQKAP